MMMKKKTIKQKSQGKERWPKKEAQDDISLKRHMQQTLTRFSWQSIIVDVIDIYNAWHGCDLAVGMSLQDECQR